MSDAAPEGPRVVRRDPVVLAAVPTWNETYAFPVAVVAESRPRAAALGTGLVLGAALGLLALVSTRAVAMPAGGGTVRAAALVLGLVVLAALYLRGHPAGYLVGGAIGVVGSVATSSGAGAAVGALCALLAWPAWVGHRSRQRWWPRLEALLHEHERVEARVVGSRAVSDHPPRLRTTVESTALPGTSWTLDVQTSPRVQLSAGDPVAVWFRPSDPGAAALVVSEDVVSVAAKTARGGSAQQA